MAIRTSRVLMVSVALLAIVLLWLWWNGRERPAPDDPNDAPWIGLPKSGMDATQLPIRVAINAGFRLQETDSNGSLAFACGQEDAAGWIKDRYIAHVVANSHAEARKIVLDVHGQQIDVSVSSEENLFLPPFPDSRSLSEAGFQLYRPAIHLQKSRVELEPIRASWNDANLWRAPQDDRFYGCSDSVPIFLEACVNGRYAARLRNICDPITGKAVSRLWQILNNHLPPPPKSEWHDAVGNPVPESVIESLKNTPPDWVRDLKTTR